MLCILAVESLESRTSHIGLRRRTLGIRFAIGIPGQDRVAEWGEREDIVVVRLATGDRVAELVELLIISSRSTLI